MKTIPTINKVAGDYKPGDLVMIAGKVGSGRTNYLVFETVHAALNKNKVLFCSSEMTTNHVAKRVEQCLYSLNNPKDCDLQKIIKPKYNMILSVLKHRTGESGIKFCAKIEENKLNLKIIKNISGIKNV